MSNVRVCDIKMHNFNTDDGKSLNLHGKYINQFTVTLLYASWQTSLLHACKIEIVHMNIGGYW